MNQLLFWIKGYVQASIPKTNAERFLNILANQEIKAYRFCVKGERCCFRIDKNAYRLLLPVARKTKAYPRIHKKCGGYYIFKKMLQHTGLYLGMLCFGLLLYILSLFIWDIEFSGNQIHTEAQLLRFLNESGIGFGCRSDRVDCAGLEAEIRKEYSDISWVSVEIRGSRMMVRIREAAFRDTVSDKNAPDSHITATQNGIITKLIVRTGTPVVKVGDSVKAGDILIEGAVNTVNEYDELIQSEAVCADGDVSLKADLSYSDRIPLSFVMKKMTGEEKKGYSLSIFNKKIFSYIPSIPYERYDIITTTVNWKISKNLYLPVSHDTISCREYEENEAIYSSSQLAELSYRRYLETIERYLESGYQLTEDNVELQIVDDECVLQGTLTLEGPFWKRTELIHEEVEGVTAE